MISKIRYSKLEGGIWQAYNVTDKIPTNSIMMCTNKTLAELTAKEIEQNQPVLPVLATPSSRKLLLQVQAHSYAWIHLNSLVTGSEHIFHYEYSGPHTAKTSSCNQSQPVDLKFCI